MVIRQAQGFTGGIRMLTTNDIRVDSLVVEFNEMTEKLKKHAEKNGIDLSKIRIRNKEAEKVNRRYMFYN